MKANDATLNVKSLPPQSENTKTPSRPKKAFKEYVKEKDSKSDSQESPMGNIFLFEALATTSEGTQVLSSESIGSINEIYSLLAEKVQYCKREDIQTITVSFQGSENNPFNGTVVQLEYFNSAPGSFHISFETTPEAMQALTQQIQTLHTSLQKTFSENIFHIAAPMLLEEYRFKNETTDKKSRFYKQTSSIFSKKRTKDTEA